MNLHSVRSSTLPRTGEKVPEPNRRSRRGPADRESIAELGRPDPSPRSNLRASPETTSLLYHLPSLWNRLSYSSLLVLALAPPTTHGVVHDPLVSSLCNLYYPCSISVSSVAKLSNCFLLPFLDFRTPVAPIRGQQSNRPPLRLSASDRARMNRLAAKNCQGKLNPEEEVELDNYIRVGQTLGIFQSKATRPLKAIHAMESGEE